MGDIIIYPSAPSIFLPCLTFCIAQILALYLYSLSLFSSLSCRYKKKKKQLRGSVWLVGLKAQRNYRRTSLTTRGVHKRRAFLRFQETRQAKCKGRMKRQWVTSPHWALHSSRVSVLAGANVESWPLVLRDHLKGQISISTHALHWARESERD